MARKILANKEIWYTKLAKPDSYRGGDPKWTLQIRVYDEDGAEELEDLGFTVKRVKNDDGSKYWRANISRKVDKADGTQREPVKVKDGQMNDVDPRTIGNGSIANIQYMPWEMELKGEMVSGRVLEAIQLVKHVVYTPRDAEEDEGFSLIETKVEAPEAEEGDVY